MFRHVIVSLLIFLFAGVDVQAAQVGKVEMPDTLAVGGESLRLNGAGIRKKFFIKLYVSGLYLQQKQGDADAIVKGDQPMAIRMVITSGMITPKKMEKATREGFDQATHGDTAAIQEKIDQFVSAFKQGIKKGDVFEMAYIPGQGTRVSKNGKPEWTIPGLDFKQALFGIWLSDRPAQESLKSAMLGN